MVLPAILSTIANTAVRVAPTIAQYVGKTATSVLSNPMGRTLVGLGAASVIAGTALPSREMTATLVAGGFSPAAGIMTGINVLTPSVIDSITSAIAGKKDTPADSAVLNTVSNVCVPDKPDTSRFDNSVLKKNVDYMKQQTYGSMVQRTIKDGTSPIVTYSTPDLPQSFDTLKVDEGLKTEVTIKSALDSALETLKTKVTDVIKDIETKGLSVMTGVSEFIKENPEEAAIIGTGAAIGAAALGAGVASTIVGNKTTKTTKKKTTKKKTTKKKTTKKKVSRKSKKKVVRKTRKRKGKSGYEIETPQREAKGFRSVRVGTEKQYKTKGGKGVKYTKTGQPYIILKSGRARFIKRSKK